MPSPPPPSSLIFIHTLTLFLCGTHSHTQTPTHTHTTMDKIWMKERIHKFFLLIQSRPFIMLILLIVVLSTILRIITPCFLVLCSIATLTCLALGTGDLLAFVLKTGEFSFGCNRRKKSSSSSSHDVSMQGDCERSFDAHRNSTTSSWRCNFAQTLQNILCSSLDFVKKHVLADIDEEGLLAECVDSTGPSLRQKIDYISSTKQGEEAKHEELDKNACVYENHFANDKSTFCTHKVCMDAADNIAHACANYDDGEAGDVPELEDCSTSSEAEEVCKSVLETSAHASGSLYDIALGDTMLQPTANGIKAATSCEEEDNSIDKHQILPLEACKQCRNVNSKGFLAFDSSSKCPCDTNRGLRKLDVTDAELQDAASEFYTLEGDVLWNEADLKKKPDCKRLVDKGSDVSPTACELCNQQGMLPVSSESFSILPSKACTGSKMFAHKPANSKVIYYVEAMRAQEENRSEGSVPESTKDMNEDVIIDQELRAIASRSGNRGEESNYMSTAGSFRDFVGSFREFDTCWPEYGMMGKREDDFVTGCCDDHARPCITHSRSRSKVLQSDPLLSKASLTREQEIMDVLWQEYNEDRRLRYNNIGKLQKDNAHKQRLKSGADSSGSTNEVLDEGNPAESMNVQANEYVMKLHNGPEHGNYDRNNADHCRFGCDKPCWHMAKERSYHRRRHFVGFCRLFRELGLKQCMQSSKVDN